MKSSPLMISAILAGGFLMLLGGVIWWIEQSKEHAVPPQIVNNTAQPTPKGDGVAATEPAASSPQEQVKSTSLPLTGMENQNKGSETPDSHATKETPNHQATTTASTEKTPEKSSEAAPLALPSEKKLEQEKKSPSKNTKEQETVTSTTDHQETSSGQEKNTEVEPQADKAAPHTEKSPIHRAAQAKSSHLAPDETQLTATAKAKSSAPTASHQPSEEKTEEKVEAKTNPTDKGGAKKEGSDQLTSLRGKTWLLKQNPHQYTIQILGTSSEKAAVAFAEKHLIPQGNSTAYFHTKHDGREWYVILYGSFPDRETAEKHRAKLIKNISQYKPWIRSFQSIHAEIQKPAP